jgi:type IV secretion system protein VirB9
VRVARFEDAQIYRLQGMVGYHIELELEAGEVFTGHGGGDLEGVSVAAHGNHVILKPRATDVDTNLLILTDRRVYRFHYLVSRQPRPREDTMFVVRFVYPEVSKESAKAEVLSQSFIQAETLRPKNFDYWYCGHRSLKPWAVSDDGIHTRLTFSPRAEFPAVFVLNDDGAESLLNFRVEGHDMVVHRIARRMILRRGRLTGCVVNRGYIGSGEHLETGTTAPGVWRDHKGPRT